MTQIYFAASNNNCNYVTHEYCCDGCGPQEQFYGCADVSIDRGTHGVFPGLTTQPLKPVTHTTQPTTYTPPPNQNLWDGFHPIDVDGLNVIHSMTTVSPCRATDMARNIYGTNAADNMCQKLCVPSSTCPEIWCEVSCRNNK